LIERLVSYIANIFNLLIQNGDVYTSAELPCKQMAKLKDDLLWPVFFVSMVSSIEQFSVHWSPWSAQVIRNTCAIQIWLLLLLLLLLLIIII